MATTRSRWPSRERLDIGVDIEPLEPVGSCRDPLERALAATSGAGSSSLPARERYACFVRMWTLKEAFAKCTGQGASLGFSAIETTLDPPGIAGADLVVHQGDVTIGDRRHSLTVCGTSAPRARPADSRQYDARTASAGSPGPMS